LGERGGGVSSGFGGGGRKGKGGRTSLQARSESMTIAPISALIRAEM